MKDEPIEPVGRVVMITYAQCLVAAATVESKSYGLVTNEQIKGRADVFYMMCLEKAISANEEVEQEFST